MAKNTKTRTSKQHLITDLRKAKKELQQARFIVSHETNRNTHTRRTLRKSIARISTALAGFRREKNTQDTAS